MRNKVYTAETLFSVLIGLVLFTLIWLNFSDWQRRQIEQINQSYQRQQALQIIENQLALKLAGQSCERHIIQNRITFRITCESGKITVVFPLGQAVIFE